MAKVVSTPTFSRRAKRLLPEAEIVYLLDLYAKNEKADLTAADKKDLRQIVSLLEG